MRDNDANCNSIIRLAREYDFMIDLYNQQKFPLVYCRVFHRFPKLSGPKTCNDSHARH